MMIEPIPACAFCDTKLTQVPKLTSVTLLAGEKPHIFDNIPTRVCPNCGHSYYNGPMISRLERLVRENRLNRSRRL